MHIRNATGIATLSLALASISGFAQAAKSIDIEIGAAPPDRPAVVVETPAPRAGYIYEPGHYAYENGRYAWTEPRWIREREGHHWTPYVLEKQGDRWHYRAGHWDDD